MTITVGEAFDEYPKPLFIIKPIERFGACIDFEYVYVNKAFCLFLGRGSEELVGHHYTGVYKVNGERQWLDAFWEAAIQKKHLFVDNVSDVISKNLTTEVFHVEPNMCGCIIHDFSGIKKKNGEEYRLSRNAHNDFLTGFYNNFYLKELEEDIYRKEMVGLTYFDINSLRRVNEVKGHLAGDETLKQVAAMIEKMYGSSQLFRIDGDEFLAITYGMNREEFTKMSEKNRDVFEEMGTASVGYCYFEKIRNLNACIEECELRMYARKKHLRCNAS